MVVAYKLHNYIIIFLPLGLYIFCTNYVYRYKKNNFNALILSCDFVKQIFSSNFKCQQYHHFKNIYNPLKC